MHSSQHKQLPPRRVCSLAAGGRGIRLVLGLDMMRIICMIPTMSAPGGAERIMSYLVSYLAERHEVALLTLDQPGVPTFYSVPSTVRQIRLGKLGGEGVRRLLRVLSRPGRIRREVRASAPDVIISFMDTMNITVLLSCVGLGLPVVVSERTDPSLRRISQFKVVLRDYFYLLARFVVVQTARAADYFESSLGKRIQIIGNPVPCVPLAARPEWPNPQGRMRIVSVGRCEWYKRLDQLIDAFASVAQRWPEWDLLIIGDGPERETLKALVRHHRLEDRIRLPGTTTDIFRELAASHLMAFPSQYEGFPNALAEGLGVGLPAIGRRGVSGVEDLIIDGKTGLLFDSERGTTALADALSELMGNAQRRQEFGNAARRHILQWAQSHILRRWEDMLVEAVGGRSITH